MFFYNQYASCVMTLLNDDCGSAIYFTVDSSKGSSIKLRIYIEYYQQVKSSN